MSERSPSTAWEPQFCEIVAVRTADDLWVRNVALSGVVSGRDFPVVWVAWEGQEELGGDPWPSEDVRPLAEHPDALTRGGFRDR